MTTPNQDNFEKDVLFSEKGEAGKGQIRKENTTNNDNFEQIKKEKCAKLRTTTNQRSEKLKKGQV